ncbi:hypothetical protein QFC21_006380 [Naganishia friedmannii]|uniref:Uncharacterized protein n=1 Tax=Naganishia friedmannii TaxID=89922 RepID=A0ACC2V3H6_9TREE|nr:hypothetical protein QFC21_006380 [Naganishia friedmannii]
MPPSTTTIATAPSTPHPQITAINLRALQRSDPSITRIVAQTAYVVAYREEEADVGGRGQGQSDARVGGETGVKWEKMGVEGSLFVYESSSPPHSGILILNRNGIHNYQKPVIPLYTDISVDGSWVYLCGVDMPDLAGLLPRSAVLESGTQTQTQTPTPTVIGDNSSRRTNNRRARTTKSSQSPQRTAAATSNNNPSPTSSAGVNPNPTVDVKKTRVALYCHHGTESQGSEEARRLSAVLRRMKGTRGEERRLKDIVFFMQERKRENEFRRSAGNVETLATVAECLRAGRASADPSERNKGQEPGA